ncbi:Holliday junction resolvase RuvX [Brachybacterium phenoliresistens]|uniref:Putative pre-16S rRNA nuclease n=1 Tax=Brachybacterium phenoliresistens TaxID=396014 RepID=Z9JXY9_9MICO|nr:Holliday junction resolvase RuvX [Brachybacterium phenoliresistens]EWS82681.1 Holliday junction resolvase [Brachybacterium phenoliresistens]
MTGQGGGVPRGIRFGVDVGDVRVGLARSDLDGLIATPIDTLARDTAAATVLDHVREMEPRAIMVGLPRRLDGSEGPAARKARDFCAELTAALLAAGQDVEVRLVDERLTTVDAHKALHSAGRKGRKHRTVVDQVAAVMILQSALETERSTGARAGELVEPALPDGTPPDGEVPPSSPARKEP